MAYTADSIPSDHGEFSGGPGLIDPETRKDRVALTNDELRMEIMFTSPDPPDAAAVGGYGVPAGMNDVDTEKAFRARNAEITRLNDPETTDVPWTRGLPQEAE